MENKPPYGNGKPSEKTFEELIEENCKEVFIDDVEFNYNALVQLLKQVREATIKECFDIAIDEDISNARIMSLPTDRIYEFEIKDE